MEEYIVEIGKKNPKQPSNKISTTKYSLLSFFPKSTFYLFSRFANIFFLVVSIFMFIPQVAPLHPITVVGPFFFVIMVTWSREAYQDWVIFKQKRRKNDKLMNSSTVWKLKDQNWVKQVWQKLSGGDLVKVEQGEDFPADLLILSTSSESNDCKVQTANLDGQRTLKTKQLISGLQDLNLSSKLTLKAILSPPNFQLNSFSGCVEFENQKFWVDHKNLLLRGSNLKNTKMIIGMVVYPGHHSKIMLNGKTTPFKRSQVQKSFNKIVIIELFLLIILSIFLNVMFLLFLEENEDNSYIKGVYENQSLLLIVFKNFGTYLILISGLIPLALVVTLEMVKFFQYLLIEQDIEMYDQQQDLPCSVQTFNIIQELGNIDYIFSDKTGTLTSNNMEFRGYSTGKHIYPKDLLDKAYTGLDSNTQNGIIHDCTGQELQKELLKEFFLCILLCNQIVVENQEYQGASPDQIALVNAAKDFDMVFLSRVKNKVTLRIQGVIQKYKILAMNEFTSDRKRMSVIVLSPQKQTKLYIKGADSTIQKLLSLQQLFLSQIQSASTQFAVQGFRTLWFAYRNLPHQLFQHWFSKFDSQRCNPTQSQFSNLQALAAEIQKDFSLLGVTAVQDKLQKGVPKTIKALKKASIKVWMITGDKAETAQNIALSCNLLQNNSQILKIVGVNQDFSNLLSSLTQQLTSNSALLIDGDSLTQAFRHPDTFFSLCQRCQTVIVCRANPKLKAQVVSFIKKRDKQAITLAVGDGGNDISMIQTAHVGVGIYGKQGHQAANSSDFAIGKFRFLHSLLFLHGRWCYMRTSKFILFFMYKQILYLGPLVCFAYFSGFSGQTIFDSWYILIYNVVLSEMGPLVYGIAQQDINPKTDWKVKQFMPELYREMKESKPLSIKRFLVWLGFVFYSILVVFFIPIGAYQNAVNSDGQIEGLWGISVCMFTGMYFSQWAVLVIFCKSWTVVTFVLVFLWGLVLYFGWVVLYNYVGFWEIRYSTFEFMSTFTFWAGVFGILGGVLIPYSAVMVWKRLFYPSLADRLIAKKDVGWQEELNTELSLRK